MPAETTSGSESYYYTSDSESYSSSLESSDPFDRHHPENDFAAVYDPKAYKWAGPGGDVDGLDPPVSLEIKKKVKAVDPCKGRCLITNATLDSGIKYTHCLPVHLSETSDLIHRLEWYWGMRMNELDLNSEYNIFPVSAQLSAMHEYPKRAPSWFLLPEDHIVDMFFSRIEKLDVDDQPTDEERAQLFSKTCRGNLPELQEKTYKYRLFPMHVRMEGMALYHIQHPPIDRPTLSECTFDVYPFDNLPWVTSQLDPKFVIVEAGRKLSLMGSWRLKSGYTIHDTWFNSQPSLRRLLLLYEAWSAPIPADAYKDPGFISLVTANAPVPTTNSNGTADVERKISGRDNPDPLKYKSGCDPSSIAQWSVEASAQTSPHDALPIADSAATGEDEDQAMDSDEQDSQFDFVIGAGSRTPPRRLILSKDGKHWY